MASDVVAMRRGLDGVQLAYRRRGEIERAGVVPAWTL